MKKILLMIVISGFFMFTGIHTSMATIHNVQAQDFEFNPVTFTANVGDTVQWTWMNGSHTTTSTDIPPNAQAWDQTLTSAMPTFTYVITEAGSYDYVCTPHLSMGMTGNFTAVTATALQENAAPSLTIIKNYVSDGQLHFDYSTPSVFSVSIELFDIVGHQVYGEMLLNQQAGVHSHSIEVAGFPKGIYILSLFAQNARLTERIVIE